MYGTVFRGRAAMFALFIEIPDSSHMTESVYAIS